MIIAKEEAVALLNQDEIVALPTETVYGLAARMDSPIAIKKIFELKKRPLDHPLIMHIANREQLYDYTLESPPYLSALMDKYWPGPLTLILKKEEQEVFIF
jgi:L-threonylcarbamoyladenylate synthase